MLGIKVRREVAEKVRQYLKQKQLLNLEYKIFSKGKFIYIPIASSPKTALLHIPSSIAKAAEAEEVEAEFERKKGKRTGKVIMQGKPEGQKPSTAYDILGNIAIIEHMDKASAKKLAKKIMQVNKQVSTVLMKSSAVAGTYRTRHYSYVAGVHTYIANYKENGCVFRFDVRRVFFSSRLAYERKRIAEQVRKNEHVMVMFAGVGPFAIEIAKMQKSAKVVAIELNPWAYKSMLYNIMANKINNVIAVQGDVKRLAKKYKGWADRIVMPLPKSSFSFLPSAFKVAKNKCIVHYYAFGSADSAFKETESKIIKFFRKRKCNVNIVFERKVREYSPKEIEIVVDFKIDKGNSNRR